MNLLNVNNLPHSWWHWFFTSVYAGKRTNYDEQGIIKSWTPYLLYTCKRCKCKYQVMLYEFTKSEEEWPIKIVKPTLRRIK
jgi:hypothetical protein